MDKTPLSPEEYKEPACPFEMDFYKPEPPVSPVPVERILRKLDEYLARNDQAAAARHLDYWLAEALAGRDKQGELALRGERMGYFRKNARREEALAEAREAERLLGELHLADSVTGGTAFLNIATVYNAFGETGRALAFYEKAKAVYEEKLAPEDPRMGGLYNNFGLALAAAGRFGEARKAYGNALAVMEKAGSKGLLERAVTLLNLANAAEAEKGLLDAAEEIEALLDEAERLLQSPEIPRDGYRAFTLEKCAPTFAYYGRFAAAKEFEEEAKRIYEGT